MKLENLHDLYVDHIKDILNAENQIVKALPKMAKAASSPELKSGFEQHLEETKTQVERLKSIFEDLGMRPVGKTCKGMAGLIEEGQELLEEEAAPDVLDAGLIAAAQKVEHYEISAYGTVATYADQLGYTKAAKILHQILEEEKRTDEKLTSLAERGLNRKAENK